jgi:hypothetical protein
MSVDDVRRTARRAGDHPAVESLARLGYAVSGVMHLLIALIAVQVAWSATARAADQSGALQTLAGNGVGRLTLWVAVVGFLGLAVWQVAEAVGGYHGTGGRKWGERAKAISKAVVYLALAWTSLQFARGQVARSGKQQTVDFTAELMHRSGGRTLVVLVGAVVVGVGVYHVLKGARQKFLRDLVEHPGRLATRAGVVGYCAKGVALAVVGLLFIVAGAQRSPGKATGLDGALHALRAQPMGPYLLTAVAIGFAAYGLYSFARARYARV